MRLHGFDAAVERALREWERRGGAARAMSEVTASVTIDAPPEEVWRTVLDPDRLSEWVTIHRKVNSADDGPPREGFRMQQTLHLRGANFKVRWALTEAEEPCSRPGRAAGRPTPTRRTSYRLTAANGARASTTRTSSTRPAARSGRPRPARWSAACPSARHTSRSNGSSARWRA